MARSAPNRPRSEDLYRILVQSVVDYAIFAISPEGRVATWNEGAERIKGWTAEEIVGKSFTSFYPVEDVERGKPLYELRVAEQDGRYEEEGWRLRKDGTRFWANVVITALRDEDGRLIGFTKVTRDLTERRLAQDALRDEQERYRLLVEGVRDYAIFALDREGRIATWNEGARRLKGWTRDEILGRHFSTFYPREAVESKHPEYELEVAVREGRYEEEGWRLRKDGSRFWASVTITAIRDRDGHHIGFSKVTRDLTDRKRAEDYAQAQAEALARVNQELEAFNYMVAHDLRAPIRAVEHLSRVAVQDYGDKLDEEGRSILDAIQRSSERMVGLVEGLLTFSRAVKGDISRSRVDVTALARQSASEAAAREPDRDVRIDVAPGLVAEADPRLLRVVLDNLLGNAVKFTRRTPQAHVEVGSAEVDGATAYFVRDNGVGFDPAKAKRLFGAFQRLHAPNDFEGTGVGLATVKRVVERHGGRVWATTEPGKGATFWFTLDRTGAP